MTETGHEAIEEIFRPNPDRAQVESEIRAWVKEQLRTEGGLARIKEAMGSREIAAVIYHSPYVLLGMSQELHLSLKGNAVGMHHPEAEAKMIMGADMYELAAKYPKVIKGLEIAYFNPEVANQALSRVEI